MELPGGVAVVDGRILPAVEWKVEAEYDNSKVRHSASGKQLGTIVTSRFFEGEMEIAVDALPTSITAAPMRDIYLFPESGTRDRVLLRDVIFSSVYHGEAGSTTVVEFVASEMER